MTFRSIRIFGLFATVLISSSSIVSAAPDWITEVGAKTFPDKGAVYRVTDYNAHRNQFVASTGAIQKAIDDCSANGGGTVIFEPGSYHTGAIYLKNNVNLHIGEGVELWALIGLEYYPEITTRVAGIEMQWPCGILNILDKKNVAVTGKGVIHAQGKYHWEHYWNLREAYTPKGLRWASDYDCKRVRTVQVVHSTNVTLKDFTVEQSGFWTVHLLYSDHITVDGLTIRNNIDGLGPSTDGVNTDSSRYVHVLNCDVDANDDNYTIKAGRDADGLRVNKPAEYVYIHDCIARRGGGALVIGSETSGWIRHVYAEKMTVIGTKNVIHLKSALTRGGGIEDVDMQNVQAEKPRTFCEITVNWNPSYSYTTLPAGITEIPEHWKVMLEDVPKEKGLPHIRDIRVSNCNVTGASNAFRVSGSAESPIENSTFENITVSADNAGYIKYTKDWTLRNVSVTSKDGKTVALENNVNLNWEK